MVYGLHAAGPAGDPRRRLQPHRRGRRARADACASAAWTTPPTTGSQDDRSRYVDDTGCGNTLDAHNPQALRLIMDSLRYWVQEMHVDGFRFDLAASLGRGADALRHAFSAFLEAVGQDPVLADGQADRRAVGHRRRRLRARRLPARLERVERPLPRHRARLLARHRRRRSADFATRADRLVRSFGRGRRPTASINLITVHDGFTLADLVSYDAKHNEANGEDNRDGTDDNRSWNCGVEGPTDDSADHRAARPPAPQPARDPAAVRGRAAAARRRRARPHPGRQQQRLLPGHRRSAGSTGRCAEPTLI